MGIFSIIGWIIFGLIAGLLAKWIMPGKDPGGLIVTILIGIAGAVIGGFLATSLGLNAFFAWLPFTDLVVAVLGGLLLLFIFRQVAGKK